MIEKLKEAWETKKGIVIAVAAGIVAIVVLVIVKMKKGVNIKPRS